MDRRIIFTNKKDIRKKIKLKRDTQTQKKIDKKSKVIINKLMSTHEYKKSRFIFVYISFGKEVKTHEFIKNALKKGRKIGVPLTNINTKEMICSEIKDFDKELKVETFGILEPKKKYVRKVKIDKIDLVIVPIVAFDKMLYRIGYGAGFYDRFLKMLKPDIPKIGLAFKLQMINSVPIDKYDISLNAVITEKNVYKRKSWNIKK